jgi:Zn-dependent protease with chaperone function
MRLRLAVKCLSASFEAGAVRASVSDSPTLGAYAWPDGRICVTRALVRLLDDEELAAAVAHEMGHLLEGGHVRSVAALSGAQGGADVELRADRAGAGLLARSGLRPDAMARMLEKVARSPAMPAASRARLVERIKRLRD